MNAFELSLLLCTNGLETTHSALDYGVWLASVLKTQVVVLGVLESEMERQNLEKLIDATIKQLEREHIPCETLVRRGRASIEISKHAQSGKYVTVVGPMGRPFWRRWLMGRTFRRLLARTGTPLLYVPEAHLELKHILVCMGGLGYAFSVEHLIFYLAGATGADLTLLNVVEPITLDYPTTREVQDHIQDLLETDTPQGRNLQKALAEAKQAGLETRVKVRHGNVVKEILEEVNTGNYDLVGLGSPYSAQSLRHLYLPNVTAEVAETVNVPVLTVRSGFEL